MIRRMVSGGSLPQSQRHEERSSRNGMDRSIHSIEEGTEENEDRQTAADYSLPPIPAFRGDELAHRRGNMDDSSHSASSLGKQSNFIQQRIDKHKKQGSWFNTSDDSDSSDDENQCDDECSENNEQHAKSGTMPRAPSMVCMLKMEPINEKEVLKNSWNNEEVKSSFVSDEIDHMGAPDDDRQRSSFLPNIESERFVEVEVTPMVDVNRVKSRDGDDSEDTFVFASIHSAENITHASDAPDYDYNSKRGEQNKSTKNEERTPAASA
eukprot:scaffold12308_cov127-Skeletonema_menzelii.AAC.3